MSFLSRPAGSPKRAHCWKPSPWRISDTLHVSNIGVLLQCAGGYCLEQSIGAAVDRGASLPATSLAIRKLRSEETPAHRVLTYNPDGWLMLAGEDEQEALKRLSAEVLLPLPGRHELVGVIALGPKRSEAPYSRSDLTLLRSVAAQTGLAIENSRLFSSLAAEAVIRERANREMEIAREVQRRLFPQVSPSVGAWKSLDIAVPRWELEATTTISSPSTAPLKAPCKHLPAWHSHRRRLRQRNLCRSAHGQPARLAAWAALLASIW